MRTVYIHPNIAIHNGYLSVKTNNNNQLFIESDILYARSAVYCWYMGLILIGFASYDELTSFVFEKSNSNLEKFMLKIEKSAQVDINFNINTHYKKICLYSGLENLIEVCKPDQKFLDLFIVNHIKLGSALIIEFEVEGFSGVCDMLITAIEKDEQKKIKALYCITPSISDEPTNYWNAIFEKDNINKEFPFCWVDFNHEEIHKARIVKVLALMKLK